MVHLGGFSGVSGIKESAHNEGNLGSIPGLGRSPGEGHGNPLQYSCLENSMDRGAWQAVVHGVTKHQTRLKGQHFPFHRVLLCMHAHLSAKMDSREDDYGEVDLQGDSLCVYI